MVALAVPSPIRLTTSHGMLWHSPASIIDAIHTTAATTSRRERLVRSASIPMGMLSSA
jgi:hypothetical protein